MGKLKIFAITLNNTQGVYYPGQFLEGHVTVELNEGMKMRGIRLQFYGGAIVRWSERHSTGSGKNRRTVTRYYSAHETYFNHELVLFGKASGQGGDNPTLSSGSYTYPFRYQLPNELPSSFEGSVGRIRYWLNGTIDKPWKFDHTTKRAFTVVNLLDLNTEPGAAEGSRGQNEKNLCCLCCKSGPISCTFQIDRCGYVPGESIPIKAEIINHSNRRMARSYAELYMVGFYRATTKTRTVFQKIGEISHGEILPGDSDTWNGDLLPIPPVPPSKLHGCRIIVIEYYVKFCVSPAGPAFQLEVPLRLIIGSIPLRTTMQQYGFAPPLQGPSQSQLYQGGAQASAPPVTSMPPPSFSESAFGTVNIKDDDDTEYTKGDMNYAPVYAYYNWGQTAQPSAPQQ
ncbi:arrestin domain-containing protein 3-like isoform X3 [Haliotis rufescens]|uniref:arrestin domain-containing protein 3-like isoform X3 n=1 Tax=Haliotis rufescens TaxID=6454 RepID=UPI00201EEA23|nr:arrestin domain-containing protein 3-like isoform X3 [Haliotis rufescens]